MMREFVSEPIRAIVGNEAVAGMVRGEPGLPEAFVRRGVEARVVELVAAWKASEPEGGRPGGERYLRRHYYKLRMSDGATWTVYFVRHTPRSGSPKARWFLYTIDEG